MWGVRNVTGECGRLASFSAALAGSTVQAAAGRRGGGGGEVGRGEGGEGEGGRVSRVS